MASLNMINAMYESDSDDENISNCLSENFTQIKQLKVTKLPLPETALFQITNPNNFLDDSTQHKGRIRSFKHERGNWATFVFISYNKDLFDEFISHVVEIISLEKFCGSDIEWHSADDIHLSLSRTVAIPHHFIDPIVESLQSKFMKFNRFSINFSASDLRFYVNDERTRSFIGFEIVSWDLKRNLDKLINDIDETLLDYRCDKFYENASYHLSFAWCLGDITKDRDCDEILKYFRDSWAKVEESAEYLFSFEANKIILKCGNKTFNFCLNI